MSAPLARFRSLATARLYPCAPSALFYLLLAVFWGCLWRLPLLNGDDRLFANASNLSHGRQTWAGITTMVDKTWNTFNGRLADGLGAAWFGFGLGGARVLMALGYVLFAFLVWVYATRLGPKDEGDYAQLSPWRTWVRRDLLAQLLASAIPFMLIGFHFHLSGDAVFSMAVVWNYLFSLNLVLLAFYPLARAARGGFSWRWQLAAAPLIVLAMVMHEMTSVAALGLVAGLLAFCPRLLTRPVTWVSLAATGYGFYLKVTAPGLWERIERNSKPTGSPNDLLPEEVKLHLRLAGTLANVAVVYIALVVLVAATLIWLHGRALLTTTPLWSRWQPSRSLWVGSLVALYVVSAACVGAWIMAGRRYLLIIDDAYGRGRYPLITQMDDASGAVIGWAIASFVMLALLALTLPRQLVGPLPLALFGAIAVSLAANSYMARSLYAGVGRDHYIALLLMGTLIITNLVALARLSGAGRAVSVLSGGVLFVATSTLVLCANQLLVNYGAWQQVEAQFTAAASGQSTLVEIPKTMPCNNVISYQWIDPPTSNVKHLRIFYGLDSKVQIKTVPQELTCGPATNR